MKNSYAIQAVLEHYPKMSYEEAKDRLTFSTFVCLDRKYMFFEVPKAGCTTMKLLLHKLEGAPPLQYYFSEAQSRRDMFIHSRRNVPLPSIVDLDDRTQKMVMSSADFLRFAIVRNPYTRLISAWKSKVVLCEPGFEYVYRDIHGSVPNSSNDLITFPEFLDYVEKSDPRTYNPHWMLQTDHLFFETFQYSFIGRMERLNETLARFHSHIGTTAPLKVGTSNSSVFKEDVTLTEEQANKVYKIYQADFEKLGYDRGDLPRLKVPEIPTPSDTYDEVLERNIIIGMMARDRSELAARVRWTPLGVAHGLRRKMRRLFG